MLFYFDPALPFQESFVHLLIAAIIAAPAKIFSLSISVPRLVISRHLPSVRWLGSLNASAAVAGVLPVLGEKLLLVLDLLLIHRLRLLVF
jgi:hypothetical protein